VNPVQRLDNTVAAHLNDKRLTHPGSLRSPGTEGRCQAP
jgi:hypothetical protein